MYLTEGLREAGWSVDVGVLAGGTYERDIERAGASLHRIPSSGRYDPRVPWRLARLIRSTEPDIVQTWLRPMDVYGGAAALWLAKPWIVSERTSPDAADSIVKNAARRAFVRRATAIVANSAGAEGYWSRSTGRAVMVPNAVPLTRIDAVEPVERILDIPPDIPVILAVGRLVPEKNFASLIEAIRMARPDAVTVICGEGPLERQLEKLIRISGCEGRIRLAGFVPEIWSWMRRAALFVSTSWIEGRSNVACEAAACGCPLVLSDIAAHREMKIPSLLIDPADPRSIADAIAEGLSRRGEARQRAAAARRTVEHCSIGFVARQYLDLYEDLLGLPCPAMAQPAT